MDMRESYASELQELERCEVEKALEIYLIARRMRREEGLLGVFIADHHWRAIEDACVEIAEAVLRHATREARAGREEREEQEQLRIAEFHAAKQRQHQRRPATKRAGQ